MTGGGKAGGDDRPGPAKCGYCKHYYVTWDPAFPHGCKAMGFKSRTSPALEVIGASGVGCQMYVPRETKKGKP